MADASNIRHLVRLLDDESESIKETVWKELSIFGPSLMDEIVTQNVQLDQHQEETVRAIMAYENRQWLKLRWRTWFDLDDDKIKLERGLLLIAMFQLGRSNEKKLKVLLDELAEEYASNHFEYDVLTLTHFLFKLKEFRGEKDDYYNPLNSNLIRVIETRRGIPISLACLYILIGHRLKLKVEGCNFPGHFLARILVGDQRVVVDCFNGGKLFYEKDLINPDNPIFFTDNDFKRFECTAEIILIRVLRNLIYAYQQAGDEENMKLMIELVDMMDINLGE
ncbi:transglutaminase-like domain-containing protein [bacterium]|nr:transglutaminase-like domain-containing protein [bacterium]